jgi:hypothetical protein
MIPEVLSPGLKQLGSAADRSLPPNAEVKKNGPMPPLPHTSSWCGAELIKPRNNLTFTCMYIGLYNMKYPN